MKPQPRTDNRRATIADPRRSIVAALSNAAAKGFVSIPYRTGNGSYLYECVRYDEESLACLSFVREINEDTPRTHQNENLRYCWHLAVSFAQIGGNTFEPLSIRPDSAAIWARAFFGRYAKSALIEPPARRSNARDIIHYRIFCDGNWQPLMSPGGPFVGPRPRRWRTWDQAHGSV